MTDKEYKEWLDKIDSLVKSKKNLKFYDLSASNVQDKYTQQERQSLVEHNKKVEDKQEEIDGLIVDILKMLRAEGYKPDEIMAKYNHLDEDRDDQ